VFILAIILKGKTVQGSRLPKRGEKPHPEKDIFLLRSKSPKGEKRRKTTFIGRSGGKP